MPTHIKQHSDPESGRTVFRVDGEMLIDDALLLERLIAESLNESGKTVEIDLADLDFLDSEAASVLRRIADDDRVTITGVEFFLQSAIDSAERSRS
ncbi:MAG: STAS domain-containing protein [Blastocatellia bacterium]|nr:STAS domain-containing protein [Chloracidobacterium sp.]MBL8185776.1 STAS domain-containing protein [Blastocatellia bacterium]HRJ88600.1 STAS domain-containing protein [Pyrinomonadaceae bacterium]HRK49467.1 STAS domain-containing protein [Pyrinomonadaceae bacterium]